MARDLAQIITELNSVYNPQKEAYNTQINAVDPQMQAEVQGLDQAKTDSFNQITQGANRRGLLFSGIPIAEQSKYVGSTYLPSLANLKGRYAQQKFNLTDALNQLGVRQNTEAQGIHQSELDRDEKQRQFNEQLAAQQAESARARSASAAGSTPWTPGGSGGGGGKTGGNVLGANTTLRGLWQKEATAGDWNAQVLLNYVGDNNNYDGAVNSLAEYNILKQMGVTGSYYVPKTQIQTGANARLNLTAPSLQAPVQIGSKSGLSPAISNNGTGGLQFR